MRIPKNRSEYFSGRLLHPKFLRPWRSRVSPFHGLLLCFWIVKIEPGFIHGLKSQGPYQKGHTKSAKFPLLHTFDGHFEIHFAEIFFMFKSAWMMWCTHSQEIFSASDICFVEIRRSDKIILCTASTFSGVDTEIGLPGLSKQPSFLQWHKKDKLH